MVAAFVAAASGCDLLFDERLIDGGGGAACDPLPLAPRPVGTDGTGAEVAFAVRRVLLDTGDGWARTGSDLDGFCTVTPESATECRPPAHNPDGSELLDGLGGTDNTFGHDLVPVLELVDAEYRARIAARYELGRGVPVLALRGWNGEVDDPRVQVVFATTAALTPQTPLGDGGPPTGDGGLQPGDAVQPPRWDGGDHAWLAPDAFEGGDLARPLSHDANGYVAGSQLVARLPAVAVEIAGMRLSDARVQATLSPGDGRLANVVVSGRWRVSDLLADTARLCFGAPRRRIMQNVLDQIADVRGEPGSGGEGVTCDAVSVGLRFEATAVRLEGLGPSVPALRPLPDFCGR